MTNAMAETTYTHDEILARLARDLPRWRYVDGFIVRTLRTQDWKGTMMAANAVGHLAEAAWHHPELSLSYAALEARLQTHSAGGITDKDFELARRIEEFVVWRPAPGSALGDTPAGERSVYIKPDV
jgi:4a-hydroxytetrahydrobiopterin dehydratase